MNLMAVASIGLPRDQSGLPGLGMRHWIYLCLLSVITVSILHFTEWQSLIPSIRLIRKHPSVIGRSDHLSFLSVTPISSGLLINSLMPDSSVLVIQESPGVIYIHHSVSLSNYSSCI